MTTIFDACTPREEVLTGEVKEQQFAASLTKVLRGTADAVYGDAQIFVANTYPTKGLKSLLNEALGRLSGKRPGCASVIRLETNFGGGKTHNLIGLYHICDSPIDPNVVVGFVGIDKEHVLAPTARRTWLAAAKSHLPCPRNWAFVWDC